MLLDGFKVPFGKNLVNGISLTGFSFFDYRTRFDSRELELDATRFHRADIKGTEECRTESNSGASNE